MDCSVVIPYKDRLDALLWVLRSLARQRTRYSYDVIIVDDGSAISPSDSILAEPERPKRVKILHQSNSGAAAARNKGWQSSTSKVIVFLDADQIVGPNFIQNHVSAFLTSQQQFLQLGQRRHLLTNSKIDLDAMDKFAGYRDERSVFMDGTSQNLGNIEVAWHLGFSHNMSMRRADLMAVGGMDERFSGWGFEDCELVYRFVKAGIKPILNPAVEAFHQSHKMGMSQANFQSWLKNLRLFKEIHPTVEVCSQDLLIPTTDPDIHPALPWSKTLLQFETVMRLTTNRPIPTPVQYTVVCETKSELLEVAASKDVAVTMARVPKKDIAMIVDVQTDPRLKEVRMRFEPKPG